MQPIEQNQLLQKLKNPIEQYLQRGIESDISGERAYQLRTLHRNERYWRGDHYSYPVLNASSGTIEYSTAAGNLRSPGEGKQRGGYAYVLNYYQGDGLKLIGVLGRIPNAKAVADSEDAGFSERAEQATQIVKQLWSHWRVEAQQPELMLSLYKNGTTFGYTPYVADSERFGHTEESIYEERSVQVSEAGFDCPYCGEFNGQAMAEPQGGCAICGGPLGPENFRDAEYANIPEPVGVERYANGSVEFHLCSPYTVTTPFYLKNLDICPWLWYEYEEFSGNIMRAHPELRGLYAKMASAGGSTSLSAEARFAREGAASPGQLSYQPFRKNYWRYSRFWLTPAVFEVIGDEQSEEMRDTLRSEYPDGAKITTVNGHLVRIESEKLSAVWAACKPTVGEYLYSLELGHNYPPLNDLINDGFNILAQTAEKGMPITLYDPTIFDKRALKEHQTTPVEWLPTLPGLGGKLRDATYETKPAVLQPATVQMMDTALTAARDVSNIQKPLYGGEEGRRQTLGEAELKRNQALMPHNTTWTFIRAFWARCYENGVTQFALHGGDKLYFAGASPSMPARSMDAGDLEGLLEGGWSVQCDEAIPMTWGQRRAQVWQILDKGDALWRLFGLAHPNNLEGLLDILGTTDIKVPGLDNVRKVASTIQHLLEAVPIEIPAPPPPMGMPPLQPELAPSIPADEFEDDHELTIQAIREWCQTSEVSGRGGIRETNPGGYANVIAHGRDHLRIIQMQMAPPMPPEGDGEPPPAGGPPPPEAEVQAPRPEGVPKLPPAPPVPEEMGDARLEAVQ